jgi:hypothetical protein
MAKDDEKKPEKPKPSEPKPERDEYIGNSYDNPLKKK